MRDNRCPECENDLSEPILTVIVGLLTSRQNGPAPMTCPHCAAELSVAANLTATLTRQA